jgi:molybdopterin-guanine dinucleotide biosynthesis protein B
MKIFGFAGYSGSGKTTLIEKLIPIFNEAGLDVSLIKHAHHDFDVDQPGKDSYRFRQAGAIEVLVSSDKRWALMHELSVESTPHLSEHLKRLSPCDIVLVEGYKNEQIPKLEVRRNASPVLYPDDPHIVGIAGFEKLETDLPQFDLNDAESIAVFIMRWEMP